MWRRIKNFYHQPSFVEDQARLNAQFTQIWIANWSSLEILYLTNEIREAQAKRRGNGAR